MKKVVILGCENSHAKIFLDFIYKNPNYPDVQVVGVYSEEENACVALRENYGVQIMQTYDEAVGKVDGVIITARHGNNHYRYAKPYIKTGVPMFIDKPITVDEEEAIKFMKELRANNIKISGGSLCKHDPFVQTLKERHQKDLDGKTLGGFVRAPLQPKSQYGGFFFYGQHLVEIMNEIFGRNPLSVRAIESENKLDVWFGYNTFTVHGLYVNENYKYFVARYEEEGVESGQIFTSTSAECSEKEFAEYYALLFGGKQKISYADFIAPVFIMNAIVRAKESGKQEQICYPNF